MTVRDLGLMVDFFVVAGAGFGADIPFSCFFTDSVKSRLKYNWSNLKISPPRLQPKQCHSFSCGVTVNDGVLSS